ncbi:MAG: hypothetical protein Q7U09_12665 [Hydrogenophaga sp.]|nr:hypothetical protein [Hydrogenophaga sp.]
MNEEGVSQGSQEPLDAEAAELRQREAHEIYKGVGRNIVLLQQMEEMLRYLAVNANISSANGSLVEQQKMRQKRWKNGSLGDLVDDYGKRILAEATESPENDEAHLSMRFRLRPGEQSLGDRKKLLRRIVVERNKLVHRLPFDWVPGQAIGYELLLAWLQKLWHELEPEWQLLRGQVWAVREMGKLMLEQFETGYFELDAASQLDWYRRRGIELEPDGD